MGKPWERQEGESEEWYGRFAAYLGLGYGRTLSKAYRLVHPESEASEVSSAWRNEYRERKWRARATEFDLTSFRGEAKRTAVLIGRSMRVFARKTLRALLSKTPAMQPASWEECQKAFETLSKMFPGETLDALCHEGRGAAEGGEGDEGEYPKGPADFHPPERWPDPPAGREPTPPA
jgi:hypothetical protein